MLLSSSPSPRQSALAPKTFPAPTLQTSIVEASPIGLFNHNAFHRGHDHPSSGRCHCGAPGAHARRFVFKPF